MKKLIITGILLSFSTSFAITYEEVEAIAQQNATKIKLTEKDIEKVQAQIKEAYSNIYPQVNLTGTYTRWDPNYITGFTPKNQYNVRVGVSQTIFNYQVFSLINVAKENLNLQQTIKEDVKQKIKDTARKLFLNSLYYKEIMKIKEENLKYWQENYKYVEQKYKAGILAKYDFMRASSQLQQAIADYELSKSNYEKSIEDLKRFLMVDQITPPEGNIQKLTAPQDEDIQSNTEVKVLMAQIKVAEKQIDYQKSANYPNLSAFANYQANNQVKFPTSQEVWKKGYNLGLSLNWTLFDGMAKDSRILQAKTDKAKSEISLQDKIKEVETEIKKAKIDLKTLEIQLQADEENLKAAQEALRLSTERFKANIANTVEVLESQSNYLNAQLSYITTLYNYNLRVFDLMNLLGK
ncbi:MAG: TolC family protein [Sulfurihydrogenibium sp.]